MPWIIIGEIDVPRRTQVVAGDEPGGQITETGVRDLVPGGTIEDDRMEPDPAIGCGHAGGAGFSPDGDDPVDAPWIELGPVAEHDHRSLDLLSQRRNGAAK
jgi:hypothetical protein